MYNFGSLLTVERGAAGIFLKKSPTPQKDVEQRSLAWRAVGARDVVK